MKNKNLYRHTLLGILCFSIYCMSCCQYFTRENNSSSTQEFKWAPNLDEIKLTLENYDSLILKMNNDNLIPLMDKYGKLSVNIKLSGKEFHISKIDISLRNNLFLLLHDNEKDWLANLLLYSLSEKNAYSIAPYCRKNKYLDWRRIQKNEDILFWTDYLAD